jgi:hypothetical protein
MLTDLGAEVLRRFRNMEKRTAKTIEADLSALSALVKPAK